MHLSMNTVITLSQQDDSWLDIAFTMVMVATPVDTGLVISTPVNGANIIMANAAALIILSPYGVVWLYDATIHTSLACRR